ncbi:MAG: hypothetical protein ABJN05_00140 [Sulfitobacter dubius]
MFRENMGLRQIADDIEARECRGGAGDKRGWVLARKKALACEVKEVLRGQPRGVGCVEETRQCGWS